MKNDFYSKGEIDLKSVPVATLAYVGDAVCSLHYRIAFLNFMKAKDIHNKVEEKVSKRGQARIFEKILPYLNQEEMDVAKRAMNSSSAGRYGNDSLYRKSTGLEAVIGYLYLKDGSRRINELLEIADTVEDNE